MYIYVYIYIYIYKRISRSGLTVRIDWKGYFASGGFGRRSVASLACPRVQASKGSAWLKRTEPTGNRRVWRFCPGGIFLKIGALLGNRDFFIISTCPNFRSRFSRSAGGCQSTLYKRVLAFLGLRYRK